MEWPGEFPEDRAFVGLQGPGISCEMDSEPILKDTKKKLNLTAYRSVRKHWLKIPFPRVSDVLESLLL